LARYEILARLAQSKPAKLWSSACVGREAAVKSSAKDMIKVMHIIADLSPGGAETMLYRVLSRMDPVRFENEVISLTSLGNIAQQIRAIGVPVRALAMKRGLPNPFQVVRLARWIRKSKPQIVQTWMYHADLLGGLAARLAGEGQVVWNIRQGNLDPRWNKPLTLWTAKACARMSRWLPRCVVSCSQAALLVHVKSGYEPRKTEVIANGFDLEEFRPDPAARLSLRRELGLPQEALLIGMAARFHPVKDHRNFVQAAERLRGVIPKVHFALCGLGVDLENTELSKWIAEAGLDAHCHLLGPREDLPRLFAAMDIFTSPSLSEAFPSVVAEAMACGTPCVATSVGDSALVVGESGRVVPPGNPDALAQAWREMIEAGPSLRRQLGTTARLRVEQHFSLPRAVERYQAVYEKLASKTQQPMASQDLSKCAE
jgi:glycosyltransferase involved in cell wall biosynthesis